MDLADLLLLVRPGHDCRAAAGVAARLATRHGAQVQGVCLAALPALEPADCYASGPDAVHEVMARMDRATDAQAAQAEAPTRAVMLAAGCDFTWTVAGQGELPVETALRARLADLVVLTRPDVRDSTAMSLAQSLIRLGGAPCLLAPEGCDPARPLDHAVLAWNGSRQAKRAMDDALPLLREARQVSILAVGQASGLESQREGLLVHLRRKGVTATLEAAPNHGEGAGHALLAWCGERQADLLVMGAFGHTPRAERWFGGVTWTVLSSAHLPVLMSC